ncbi:flagella synthesis protein FlgN [Oxalicibacterium faecigallinarum]|uniref:Flagellar protein FlgN n=1 Tax=Oxalicibacterium faecigallinarum TaxID=573741 RepID=A0A8J3F177_9BURK|nr:flagellar protein FlgN [Oxalicibacterium faecigallinarum]GGI16306.1 hypothetical protein GCM10008066_03300 [Oxalicibacterium faecigallinarum]
MSAFGTSPAVTLIDEQEAMLALTSLLEQEQKLLIAADIERIAALTEPKALAAAKMAELASQRHDALAAAGHDASEIGMQAWLATTAAPAGASEAWKKLITIAEEAKEINRINGTLINKQMARNQAVLNVLQHGNEQGGSTYGPKGQSGSKSIGRHIVA